MKYTLIIFTLLFACQFSFAQTAPLEGKENAVELNEEIEGKKKDLAMAPDFNSVSIESLPLYIIEGVIVDRNSLDDLNPKMIKSISVLKDENATAIYGDKGGNGVIIVTLKEKYAKKFKKKYEKKKKKDL